MGSHFFGNLYFFGTFPREYGLLNQLTGSSCLPSSGEPDGRNSYPYRFYLDHLFNNYAPPLPKTETATSLTDTPTAIRFSTPTQTVTSQPLTQRHRTAVVRLKLRTIHPNSGPQRRCQNNEGRRLYRQFNTSHRTAVQWNAISSSIRYRTTHPSTRLSLSPLDKTVRQTPLLYYTIRMGGGSSSTSTSPTIAAGSTPTCAGAREKRSSPGHGGGAASPTSRGPGRMAAVGARSKHGSPNVPGSERDKAAGATRTSAAATGSHG